MARQFEFHSTSFEPSSSRPVPVPARPEEARSTRIGCEAQCREQRHQTPPDPSARTYSGERNPADQHNCNDRLEWRRIRNVIPRPGLRALRISAETHIDSRYESDPALSAGPRGGYDRSRSVLVHPRASEPELAGFLPDKIRAAARSSSSPARMIVSFRAARALTESRRSRCQFGFFHFGWSGIKCLNASMSTAQGHLVIDEQRH